MVLLYVIMRGAHNYRVPKTLSASLDTRFSGYGLLNLNIENKPECAMLGNGGRACFSGDFEAGIGKVQ